MEQGFGSEAELRQTAEAILSLNLADLDIAELERRLDLMESLEKLPSAMPMKCGDLDCGRFRCGAYS